MVLILLLVKNLLVKLSPNSLISVGKNNRYGYPKEEVLNTLKSSKIYRWKYYV